MDGATWNEAPSCLGAGALSKISLSGISIGWLGLAVVVVVVVVVGDAVVDVDGDGVGVSVGDAVC